MLLFSSIFTTLNQGWVNLAYLTKKWQNYRCWCLFITVREVCVVSASLTLQWQWQQTHILSHKELSSWTPAKHFRSINCNFLSAPVPCDCSVHMKWTQAMFWSRPAHPPVYESQRSFSVYWFTIFSSTSSFIFCVRFWRVYFQHIVGNMFFVVH